MILLDTHVALWLAGDRKRISVTAMNAIQQAHNNGGGVAISAMTLLELAILAFKNRYPLAVPFQDFLMGIEERFTILPLSARACTLFLSLPRLFPRDPADRIIAATALSEGIPLVTSDEAIRRSGAVQTIW